MRKGLNIKAYFRENTDKKTSTVYFKIFLNGTKTREFSVGISVQNRQIAKNGMVKNAQIQGEIERLKVEIRELHAYLNRHRTYLTAKVLRDEFLKPKAEIEILKVIQAYMNDQKNQVVNRTYKNYFSYRRHFHNFLITKKLEHLTVHELDAKLGWDYLTYLQENTDISNVHIGRCLGFIKSVLRYAQKQELIEYSSFMTVERPKYTPKLATYLEEPELEKLQMGRLANSHLDRVRDLFVFQCFTGFAYTDMVSFSPQKHVSKDTDGTEWINKKRDKTGSLILVELFPEARQILNKYAENLPIISNQKYNKYLKEVAEILGICKHLTSHVARHTSAMIWLNKGMSLEAVAKMLGHSSTRITEQTYARVAKNRLKSEINQFIKNKPLSTSQGLDLQHFNSIAQ